jgi:hypothetical protein
MTNTLSTRAFRPLDINSSACLTQMVAGAMPLHSAQVSIAYGEFRAVFEMDATANQGDERREPYPASHRQQPRTACEASRYDAPLNEVGRVHCSAPILTFNTQPPERHKTSARLA